MKSGGDAVQGFTDHTSQFTHVELEILYATCKIMEEYRLLCIVIFHRDVLLIPGVIDPIVGTFCPNTAGTRLLPASSVVAST